MDLRKWLLPLAVVALGLVSQYLYHPSIEVMTLGFFTLGLLVGLVAWSARRLGRGYLKLLVVSLVAGFMYTQALDVIYSVTAAAAGMRWDLVFEMAAASALIFLASLVIARALGPEKQEDADPEDS